MLKDNLKKIYGFIFSRNKIELIAAAVLILLTVVNIVWLAIPEGGNDGSVGAVGTDGAADKEIVFSDEVFAKVIKEELNKDTFYQSDLNKVESLTITEQELTDISDLEYFKGLKTLIINGTDITDIGVIGKLPNIEELYLKKNRIDTIKGIENAQTLVYIDLSENKLSDISPLFSLEKVEVLNVSGNYIEEISPEIGGMKALHDLFLGDNQITNFTFLEQIKSLKILNIDRSRLRSIAGIESVEGLEELSVSDNLFKDISFIECFPNLKKLVASDNLITELNLPDTELPLEYLELRNNFITVADFSVLKNLNAIYIDSDIDRSAVDFMIDNFKNGDKKTKQYVLGKIYNLG